MAARRVSKKTTGRGTFDPRTGQITPALDTGALTYDAKAGTLKRAG
jgi:hypothetical protein